MADGTDILAVVLMGVSGSGKTTIGKLLAKRLGVTFADADDYHSAGNKAKMAAGTPLTDEDRVPWLRALNGVLQGWVQGGKRGVLACSALKAVYRETLSDGIEAKVLAFVWLDASKDTLKARLTARQGHFMHADLLDSQLATLEPPAGTLRVVNDRMPEAVVDEIVSQLGLPPAGR